MYRSCEQSTRWCQLANKHKLEALSLNMFVALRKDVGHQPIFVLLVVQHAEDRACRNHCN